LKKKIYRIITTFSLIFLSFFSARAQTADDATATVEDQSSLEVIDSGSGMVLSDETLNGVLDLGTIDALGVNQGNPSVIDGIFFVGNSNELVSIRNSPDFSNGTLYVIGADLTRGALEINARNTTGNSALLMSSTGELNFYISKADTPWSENTVLDDPGHPRLPDNDFSVVIKGRDGLLDTNPVTDTDNIMAIDLAARVSLNNMQGETTDIITFTLVSE
jgi:hypothetical protein